MWPFKRKKPKVIYPFHPLVAALRDKDPDLYLRVGRLPVAVAVREWKKVYRNDFPEIGGADSSRPMPSPPGIKG